MSSLLIVALVIVGVVLKQSVYILQEYERGVVFFLGRIAGVKGPGLVVLIPFVQQLRRIDLRTVTMDVPPQDVITRDNVSVKVNAVVYFRVVAPDKAIIQVENYLLATNQLCQTTLRSVCGEKELDELLSKREEVNRRIQEYLDNGTGPWGIKVSGVEVKHIDLPQEMQRAMAKQAEAERERRAKIIQAEGELQAADKLTAAAKIMSESPATIQLRYLETLKGIAVEHNSTIIFPVPMDILEVFRKKLSE
jgi:regulator of protease activity HflC (stomatin/prohibitin superfamily)